MAETARWRGESNVEMDYFLNNQTDALIIQIYSVIKLYMFRSSSVPIIRISLLCIRRWLSFMQVSDDRFQAQSEVPS